MFDHDLGKMKTSNPKAHFRCLRHQHLLLCDHQVKYPSCLSNHFPLIPSSGIYLNQKKIHFCHHLLHPLL
uniref:Uncharacterized protein MANES_11G120800 n=1 Tax=Rhizophora mucronata TaxID=61149 RepID=A0A2P2LII8_RHIMU